MGFSSFLMSWTFLGRTGDSSQANCSLRHFLRDSTRSGPRNSSINGLTAMKSSLTILEYFSNIYWGISVPSRTWVPLGVCRVSLGISLEGRPWPDSWDKHLEVLYPNALYWVRLTAAVAKALKVWALISDLLASSKAATVSSSRLVELLKVSLDLTSSWRSSFSLGFHCWDLILSWSLKYFLTLLMTLVRMLVEGWDKPDREPRKVSCRPCRNSESWSSWSGNLER